LAEKISTNSIQHLSGRCVAGTKAWVGRERRGRKEEPVLLFLTVLSSTLWLSEWEVDSSSR
jgi:hypothetical protein